MSSQTQSPGSVEQSTGLTFKYSEEGDTHNTILALICGNNGPGIVHCTENYQYLLWIVIFYMWWERHRYRRGSKCYLKVIRVYLASQRWREILGNISYTMSNYANLWHTIEIYSKSWEISFYFLQRWNFGAFDISIWILLTHNYSLFLIFEQRQRVLFRFCILNWNTKYIT